MSTQPTPSSSRLRASPNTPWGSWIISPAMALSRPKMRAMPSPTDTTVPTSAISTDVSRPSICRLRISVISSTLICIRHSYCRVSEAAKRASCVRNDPS